MSSKNKYNTTYSAEDIEKYLKGELSPREMHDLENAALEDPFLADALDGMSVHLSSGQAVDDTGLGRDLDELHTRLNARITAGRGRNSIRRSAPRWAIAAAIILLLGIGCAIYYTSFTGVRSKVAASSHAVVASSPQPAEMTAPPRQATPPVSITSAEPPSLPRTTARTKPRTEDYKAHEDETLETKAREDKPRHERTTATTSNAIPNGMRNATPKTTSNPLSKADAEADSIAGTSATAGIGTKPLIVPRQLEGRLAGVNVTLDSSARLSMARPLGNRTSDALVFRGRVLDNHDNPVPGASLTLKGYTNTGTVTDQQGQFKLYLPPQDSTRYLEVAMIGYGQKSLPLSTLTANGMADHVIHLQPSEASLQEVVISGYGIKRKETMAATPSDSDERLDSLWLKARPVIGRNAYLQYLDTAQKALALDSSIKGTETVSFEVDKQGTLTSFKIEQSLSPAHDEAIIRLVKEGPAWELLKQKKDRIQVSLHF
jgi:hypothetical protein